MDQTKPDTNVLNVLNKIGLLSPTKLAPTLQGSIWRANLSNVNGEPESLIVKVTSQSLHSQRATIINGKTHTVLENITLEQAILKYLTYFNECPQSIVKHKRFFKSKTDYFLLMEDGGTNLFDFVVKSHQFIKHGVLSISNWQIVVKTIFKQMIEAIDFIHSKNVCHYDISLENFVINDVLINVHYDKDKHAEKVIMKTDGLQVKLCDFGLAQLFADNEFKSSKFVGKKSYKSPEINHKIRGYNAKKNDIFCLGVCLFMLCTGSPPWTRASIVDEGFKYIVSGYLKELLQAWGVLHYVNDDLCNLLQGIFKYEFERIELKDIKKHLWLNSE